MTDHGGKIRRHLSVLIACAVGICLLTLVGGDARGLAQAVDPYQVDVVQTSADLSQALTPLPPLEFSSAPARHEPVISVDGRRGYQHVRGFGAAMTDSSAWLIERKLAPSSQQALMSELFGPTGLHLNFLRVPIGASDFTSNGRPYSYDDLRPGMTDPTLSHFSIAHDASYILPALRAALALNSSTEFLATPWSPPAWMKSNHSLGNAGDRGMLLRRYYRTWANYVVKFIQAYATAGIPIGALTPQNEPQVATLYPGMNFSAAAEASWIAKDLTPALAGAKLHPEIFAGDIGWGPTTAYDAAAVDRADAHALSGLAWHCYFGAPGVMSLFHALHPGLDEIVDECSPGLAPTSISEIVIGSLRNWASTVALWNLALNLTGGPAQPPNHGCEGCSGLAKIDPKTGAVSLNDSYYQLGQASEFIVPGAQRIASGHFVSYKYSRPGANIVSPGLDDVAVRNPDGSIVLVAYDNSGSAIRFAVSWRGHEFSYRLPAGATATFVWNRP